MGPWQAAVQQRDQLGESPFWHPDEQMLYWVDIPGRQLHRSSGSSGAVQSWALPQEPGCIAPARSGGLVLGLRDGIYRARHWGEAPELLQRFDYDPATTRFNDGKADPQGRFWAGTMFEPKGEPRAELFSLDCRPWNGRGGAPVAERKAGNAVTGNGLAWSPAADTVYWADTQAHCIRAWDWDGTANEMRHERVFHQFEPKPAGWQPGQPGYGGRPDGAAVDVEGNYWCAMYEGGRLVQLSAAGAVLQSIDVPMLCPTMPCFGGEDLRTLYLTSAGNRPAQELATRPWSGQVVATRVDVPGLPVNFFID